MSRDDIEHVLAILDTTSSGERVAEDHFIGGIVHLRSEDEVPIPRVHRPARQRARDLDDVLLRVAAIDA